MASAHDVPIEHETSEAVEYRFALIDFAGLDHMRMMAKHHVCPNIDRGASDFPLIRNRFVLGRYAPMAGQGHKIDLCSQRANILAHGFELGWVCECVRDRLGTGHFECPRTWLVNRMRLDCRASGTVCRSRVIARPEHRRVAQEAETNAVLLDDHRPPCLGERFADAAMKDPDC